MVASPFAEKVEPTFPPAAGTYTPLALASNVALSCAEPGSKAEPVAVELKFALSAPCP